MKKEYIISFVVVFAVILAGVIFYFKAEQNNKLDKISEIIKENFMTGCASGSNFSFCSCAYDKLESKVGISGIVELSNKFNQTQTLPDGTLQNIADCVPLYKN